MNPPATRRPGQGFPLNQPPVRLVTIGSLNLDLVVRSDRFPRSGETLTGTGFERICGGKGANQAVAAARLGSESYLLGRVGEDPFGVELRGNLDRCGVRSAAVLTTPDCPSGIALIQVDGSGENCITIVSGANSRLCPADVAACEALLAQAHLILMQLEIPLETVETGLDLARQHGVPVLLDPAPPPPTGLPARFFQVDWLTPNQREAEMLTGWPVRDRAEAEKAGAELLRRGAQTVVVKLGADGAMWMSRKDPPCHVPGIAVKAVDTTAAGDAFSAALAVAVAEGRRPVQAVRFACAAGALAVTVPGAQPSMPERGQVEKLLQANPWAEPGPRRTLP